MVNRSEIRKQLENNDLEFLKLINRHRKIDVETSELNDKRFLIPVEEKKLQNLKREKLRLRDLIEAKVQDAMNSQEQAG